MKINPFHLAFPVNDLKRTEQFYQHLLGCKIGRTSDKWIDFDFFGNQITAHLKPEEVMAANKNIVDGKAVPVRHFGAILEWDQWHKLVGKLREEEINFVIEPYIRFKGEAGEQATMFFYDPSGNALEFKSFKDMEQIFAT